MIFDSNKIFACEKCRAIALFWHDSYCFMRLPFVEAVSVF